MDTGSFLYAAAKMLYFLAFLGILPGNMKEQTFITTHMTVSTGKLKNPVQVALISDLHLQEYGIDNIDLVNAVKTESPDIITITGDMMNKGNDEYGPVLSLCRQLVELAPVYFVYGNHEYDMVTKADSRIGEDLKAIGVEVLDSEWKTISVNGNLIDIGGISRNPRRYNWTDTLMMNSYMNSPNFRLLLVHDPGFFDPRYTINPDRTLIGKEIDAALCGHRHGGQVGVPLVGGLFMPDVGFFPDFTAGDNLVGNTHVIVSRGLGDHNPIPRINDPHELVIITLQ